LSPERATHKLTIIKGSPFMLRPYMAKKIFFIFPGRCPALPWAGILRPFRAKKCTPFFRMHPLVFDGIIYAL